MRNVSVAAIEKAISELCIKSNIHLDEHLQKRMIDCRKKETSATAAAILDELIDNARIAKEDNMPICQDTGMAVVYICVGQEVHFTDGSLEAAIHRGVADGYKRGYLRASVVADPILRDNTKDNTPAVILWDVAQGDRVELIVAPKGFGSENMSSLCMLSPSQGVDGIKKVIIDTVVRAGPNPCPPVVVGIGIGGTMDRAAYLAKRSLMRPVGSMNAKPHIRKLEQELLEMINQTNIGPAGLGGRTTALAVHIETYPTHIAGLPVAVNMSCHATRHARIIL